MESKVAQYIWFSHRKKILASWDTSGGLQTWADPSLQTLAPEQKVAGVTELGCVPEMFLGCPTTGRACANRCDHFLDIGDKPSCGSWCTPNCLSKPFKMYSIVISQQQPAEDQLCVLPNDSVSHCKRQHSVCLELQHFEAVLWQAGLSGFLRGSCPRCHIHQQLQC